MEKPACQSSISPQRLLKASEGVYCHHPFSDNKNQTIPARSWRCSYRAMIAAIDTVSVFIRARRDSLGSAPPREKSSNEEEAGLARVPARGVTKQKGEMNCSIGRAVQCQKVASSACCQKPEEPLTPCIIVLTATVCCLHGNETWS